MRWAMRLKMRRERLRACICNWCAMSPPRCKRLAYRRTLLTLEITETVLMERTSESLEVLNALSALGVQLAIDDFGTGYSSLAYLRTFPFDFLKIDREFVAGLDQTEGHSVIVRAIIQLAHTLGLKVVAEGTESIGEIECLQEFGCDQAQGYFYARPLPGDELEKLLAAENLIGK